MTRLSVTRRTTATGLILVFIHIGHRTVTLRANSLNEANIKEHEAKKLIDILKKH